MVDKRRLQLPENNNYFLMYNNARSNQKLTILTGKATITHENQLDFFQYT